MNFKLKRKSRVFLGKPLKRFAVMFGFTTAVLSICAFPFPALALLYSRSVGSIAVFGVAGVRGQKLAGNFGAFSAVGKALVLAADRDGALSVKGVSVGFYTALAAAAFLILAARAVQSAA